MVVFAPTMRRRTKMEWLTMKEAADVWNKVTSGRCRKVGVKAMGEQKMRALCREDVWVELGVEYMKKGGSYLISKNSLCLYLWLAGQEVSQNAEDVGGIDAERRYEIIGEVGEVYHGEGRKMDDYWRDVMAEEFLGK